MALKRKPKEDLSVDFTGLGNDSSNDSSDKQKIAFLYFDLDGMTNAELIELREQINKKTKTLTDINLEEELVAQFISTKELLKDIYDDNTETSSQKAALINSCNAILKSLATTQAEIHNAERVKILENTLIETLRDVDIGVIDKFIELYATRLEENLS